MAVGQNQWYHFGIGAPPILEPILVKIGMFTGGIPTHGHVAFLANHALAHGEGKGVVAHGRRLTGLQPKKKSGLFSAQRLPIDLGPSNKQVLRPPNTSGVSNGGVGSSSESPRSLWVAWSCGHLVCVVLFYLLFSDLAFKPQKTRQKPCAFL